MITIPPSHDITVNKEVIITNATKICIIFPHISSKVPSQEYMFNCVPSRPVTTTIITSFSLMTKDDNILISWKLPCQCSLKNKRTFKRNVPVPCLSVELGLGSVIPDNVPCRRCSKSSIKIEFSHSFIKNTILNLQLSSQNSSYML